MNFEHIAGRHPQEKAALRRLADLFAIASGRPAEFTLNGLCDQVQPASRERLALILGDLVDAGYLEQIIRVVSPSTQGGIRDFSSLADLPRFIHDWRTDTELEVRPSHLLAVYRLADPPHPRSA